MRRNRYRGDHRPNPHDVVTPAIEVQGSLPFLLHIRFCFYQPFLGLVGNTWNGKIEPRAGERNLKLDCIKPRSLKYRTISL